MIICVDSETMLLTPSGTIMAGNVVAGDTLLSNNLRPNRVRCVSECDHNTGREKSGVITCPDHTSYTGSVCKNMVYDPYVLGYVVVNHLKVGNNIVIHDEQPSVLNYLQEQNIISDRDGMYGVTIDPNYFQDYNYDSLTADDLRLCSNDYIRYILGGIVDAIGSYFRGVTTLNLSDEYYHVYDLIHYILNRLNIKYMEVTQEVAFTTLAETTINYYTIRLQNVASSVPTKRFDYTYSESIPTTRNVPERRLIQLDVPEPIVTQTLSVLTSNL